MRKNPLFNSLRIGNLAKPPQREGPIPSWAYMLRCADGSFYTGCTTDLDVRVGQHQGGEQPGYTATRRPVELVWAEEFQHIDDAIRAERRIKGWSRAKKQALIGGDWERIRRLGSRARPPAES